MLRPWRAQYSTRSGTRAIVPSSFMTSQITPAGFSPARRARSTAASVWPARSSTPPGRLLSGNTCPGWTRSRGRLAGSIATWIVCARSCAEMPVVTPSRASIETVNGRFEGRLVLRRHQVEPELVAALGRQRQADQAAPLLGHEVDRLGRGELRGQREVALVLAVLVVAHDDHPARGGCPRSPARSSRTAWRCAAVLTRATASSRSTCLARMSTSTFTRRPRASLPRVVRCERLGDQRDREAVARRAR